MKILKNTTVLDISLDMGITVLANSSREIIVQDYTNMSGDTSVEQLDVLIDNGSIVVNDGTNDLSIDEAKAFIRLPDDALSVRYDNTNSDVTAKNVQDAIDELSSAAIFNEDKILTGYKDFEVLVDSFGNVLTEE